MPAAFRVHVFLDVELPHERPEFFPRSSCQ
jgi:hypothetical protein